MYMGYIIQCKITGCLYYSLGKHCIRQGLFYNKIYITRLWCSECNRADVVTVTTKFNWPNDRIDFATEVFLPPGVIPLSIAARPAAPLGIYSAPMRYTLYIYMCVSKACAYKGHFHHMSHIMLIQPPNLYKKKKMAFRAAKINK